MSLCNHDDIEIYKAVDVFRKKHQILTIYLEINKRYNGKP